MTSKVGARAWRVIALGLLLFAPTAFAHIDHPLPRTVIQGNRAVDVTLDGAEATVDLRLADDPLRDLVRHTIDPSRGVFAVEHRPTGSDAASAFRSTVRLDRFIEYRDANADLRYDPGVDTISRAWRLDDGRWTTSVVSNAQVGGASAKIVSWTGNLSAGGPRMQVLMAAAGRTFSDEGALAAPNDVMLYVDVWNLPPRPTGHLHAFDGVLVAAPEISVDDWVAARNVTTAVLARQDRTLAYFQWGGEGIVDGRERLLEGTLGDSRDTEDGVEHALRIQFPIMDRSARLVLVEGLQYVRENKRTDGADVVMALSAFALAAVALARFSRSTR